jgi:diaminopimelate epimerase
MLKQFIKYQSLGNDFVVFDWFKKPEHYISKTLNEKSWESFVKNICDRHFGAGADCVLVLKSSTKSSLAEMIIFNSDGSQAESCLNGLRCIAHHLFTIHGFPTNFKIKMGNKIVDCTMLPTKNKTDSINIVTTVGGVSVGEKLTIMIDKENKENLDGTIVSVGNPHFIIFQKKDLIWLKDNGAFIETHKSLPEKTNVEFVWPDEYVQNRYHVIIYERGCGVTLACSSGATAITGLLLDQGKINTNEDIELIMPGGTLMTSVNEQGLVVLKAPAQRIFIGELEAYE